MYTPIRQATFGVLGTFVTCLPMVLVLALLFRARGEPG